MAVTSNRVIGIDFQGDVNAPNQAYEAAENATSPGSITIAALSAGNNSVSVPSGAKSVTIVPPSGNAQTLTLKGVNGDTGIALHATDPSSLAIASSVTAFVIAAGGTVTGIRFVWA